jgi:hypothetical protein
MMKLGAKNTADLVRIAQPNDNTDQGFAICSERGCERLMRDTFSNRVFPTDPMSSRELRLRWRY